MVCLLQWPMVLLVISCMGFENLWVCKGRSSRANSFEFSNLEANSAIMPSNPRARSRSMSISGTDGGGGECEGGSLEFSTGRRKFDEEGWNH
jgi:hypothetical protein